MVGNRIFGEARWIRRRELPFKLFVLFIEIDRRMLDFINQYCTGTPGYLISNSATIPLVWPR